MQHRRVVTGRHDHGKSVYKSDTEPRACNGGAHSGHGTSDGVGNRRDAHIEQRRIGSDG